MKVEGPSRSQQTSKTKKSEKSGEADGSFGEFVASAPTGAASTQASQSIAKVDVLLAVQGADDPTARAARQRMVHRGSDLLKELDGLRMALLNGNMTVGHVIDIADVVASHREKVTDPKLTTILDEIDLRAQIEIAKMRKALSSRA